MLAVASEQRMRKWGAAHIHGHAGYTRFVFGTPMGHALRDLRTHAGAGEQELKEEA